MSNRTIRRVPGGFVITTNGVVEQYTHREVPAKFGGRSFVITTRTARGPRTLNVTVHPEPAKCWCSCWRFHLARRCRHLAGLAALYPPPVAELNQTTT